MTDNIIDLDAYRRAIAKAIKLGETEAQKIAGMIVSESISQAERAFAVAEPIRTSDELMSRIIYKGARRQMRADIRRAARILPEETKAYALAQADEIYRGRIIALCEASEISAKLRRQQGQPTLSGFQGAAESWVSGYAPGEVQDWLRSFVRSYAAAVLAEASVPRHLSNETPNRDAAISAAFDELMAPYRGDPRRKYLGSMFDRIMGASIRLAFIDHIEQTAVQYGQRSNPWSYAGNWVTAAIRRRGLRGCR